MSLDDQFNLLNEKLQLLLKQHARVQRENQRLKEELEATQNREAEARSSCERLQDQISILKMSSGQLTEPDKKEFEKKLNQYLKEVDKCIAFLGQ